MHDRPAHWPEGRPQVVAHRGSSYTNAEHTLGAYLAALDEGAEALECDVRLTADGHLVCVHDRDLRRTAATKALVSNMELAELSDLDFARWKNPWAELDDDRDEPDPERGKVLTLRRLLETVAEYPRRVDLAIETKHPTRFGGLVERRLVSLLSEFGWTGSDSPARIMSFSVVALKRIERLAPDLDVVLLFDSVNEWVRTRPMANTDWIAGPGIELLQDHPKSIRRIGAKSRIHCWTVNTEADLARCLELGVEAVISDRPGMMLSLLTQKDATEKDA